ncbi:MAG: AMP-binding protein [Lachnospiraceae bacterium]|nr:AMP-binding protein [Lachnospiraceae bacterium]
MLTKSETKTIYDLVHGAGREYNSRVFLRYETQDVLHEVTYQTFMEECDAFSSWLEEQDRTVGRKMRVAILGSSSHPYLTVLLGVMSHGNVVIPLDVQLDYTGLADCLNRSDVDILFYDWEHHSVVEGARALCPTVCATISLQHGKHVPCLDGILTKYKGQSVLPDVREKDCAMVLFTSGTTGKSKGVMLSNANLIDNVFNADAEGNADNRIMLNVLPIHHVFCINCDVLSTLRYGSVLALNQDMRRLSDHLKLFAPTEMRVVPMIAKALYNRIALLSRQEPKRSIFEIRSEVLGKNMRRITTGGGYLAPELAANFWRIGVPIAQGYGMSECAPKIASADWNRQDKVASVGKVVRGCQIRIVAGEIQVKSPSVMMGYYKDPERTAEVMTEDGWLCTGDLGYVDEDDFLWLTGRKKNLIVLSNGENVAPEQLENLFEGEQLIEEILVYGEDDAIVAEVFPNFKYADAASVTDIRAAISETINRYNQELPSYKRIARFTLRDTPFPKTSSKKILRSHYFEQKKNNLATEANALQPENDLQKQIYDLIISQLGHSRFGIDTDIFEAGLDSMGSVMLLAELYDKLHFSITLNELMSNPTVEKLEALCRQTQERAQASSPVDYTPREIYPLTNLQLYFAYVVRGNTTANLPYFFRLGRRIDLLRLKKAIEDVFEVHPALKNIVQLDEGVFKNFRDDSRKIDIPIVKMSDSEWEKTKGTLLVPYLYTPGEPLYHIAIYETESANYLFFDIAHIIGDGTTMHVLFEDIDALYHGKTVEKETYSFYEYILDEKQRDAEGVRTKNEAYFQNLMQDFRIRKSILARTDCHDLGNGQNASLKGRFTELTKKKLLAFCRENAVSENVLFLTAFNYTVGIFSNEKDVVSSSIHSGRTDSRWARIAGPLFLTYFFRYTNVPHKTVPELLKKSARQIMDTMNCTISTLHADEMFIQYQGDLLHVEKIGGEPITREPLQLDSLPFHLQIMADDRGYFYELRYWENRFDRSQLEIFLTAMEAITKAMLDESSVRRLKSYLPQSLFPKHYATTAAAINEAAGFPLIPTVSGDTRVKAYVFDETCRKQPLGAWGQLYILDYPTTGYLDQITNPYGSGVLYQTGKTARILPDGTLDLLEKGGRTVIHEGIKGRHFLDLYKLETLLTGYEGVRRAEAYVRYAEKNQLVLIADIYGSKEPDPDKLRAYLADYCEESLIPADIRFHE